jgi:hypothetical protein
MRLEADWMVGADDRILEFLREEGPSSPTQMVNDGRVRYSRTYINMRLKQLAEHTFVLNLGNGIYQVTDRAIQYLDGEIDAADLDTGENGGERSKASARK